MPPKVATSPASGATSSARAGRLVSLRAMAAGPMSSAVYRMAPTAIAESDTASASTSRNSISTSLTRTP